MPLRRAAGLTLGLNLLVILWGALVRASGSGAGCGRHWPLCNGQVVPETPTTAATIEFIHRLTSGLALVAVALLVVAVFRTVAPGHRLRRAAVASLVLIIIEALVGAGLVLLELVGDNSSMLRAGYLALHLTNTFALLAALVLVWRWSSEPATTATAGRPTPSQWAALGLTVLVGATGAVTALGDTLFPAGTLGEGLAQDQSATAHLLVRLRVIHPALAVATGLYLCWIVSRTTTGIRPTTARWVVALTIGQLAVGTINLLLLVPIATQMLHLLVADLLWLSVVLWVAEAADGAGAKTAAPAP